MKRYFAHYFGEPGYVYQITDWKILNEPEKNKKQDPYINKEEITDFDGLYFICSKPEEFIGNLLKSNRSTSNSLIKKTMVVVEGKHELTNEKINMKIKQMKRLQKYCNDANNSEYLSTCV